jgi:hypothetical protein
MVPTHNPQSKEPDHITQKMNAEKVLALTTPKRITRCSDKNSVSTPERTPETSYSSSTEQDGLSISSHSTSLGLGSPPIPELSYSVSSEAMEEISPMFEVSSQSIFLPLSSDAFRGPWKMTLTERNTDQDAKCVKSLYLRSMSNILYDFGIGKASEMEVSSHLITALFYRDNDLSRYWGEEEAQIVKMDEKSNVYKARKMAKGWAANGKLRSGTSSGRIAFLHSRREIRVIGYGYSVEIL